MGDLDRGIAHRIDGLSGSHDLSGRKGLDLETPIRRLAHVFGEQFAGAEQGVERLRKSRRQAPADLGRRLRDGRARNESPSDSHCGALDEVATFYSVSFPVLDGEMGQRRA
jgi:hypothetical protein